MPALRRFAIAITLGLFVLLAADGQRFPGSGLVALADDGDGDGGDGGGGGGGSDGAGGGADDDDDDDEDTPAAQRSTRRGDMALREVLAAGLNRAQLATLTQRGYEVLGERGNALMGQRVLLLRAPVAALLRDPVAEVRALGRNVLADRNHYYRSNQGEAGAAQALLQLAAWPAPAQRCSAGVPIGLIDTAVDLGHPSLRGAPVRVLALPGKDGLAPSDPSHGTALAALLVGQGAGLPALAPRGRLLAVDAFQRGPLGDQRMEAWDLLAALDTVVGGGARVVNMSFAGGANTLLAQALERMHRRGIVTVAAVGNRGPRAAPQYPAAYPDVVAVTAVGADRQVYHRAGRGAHVDLAAPGVDIPTAEAGGTAGLRSGTSFATPFVTAAVAAAQRQRARPVAAMQRLLADSAQDLGAPGRDPVYGHGLLQAARLCRS
ncbi:S8 family serine peptidase [Pseudorhodoferax sp.]|uniref:S8 family serine peptidase n=1 Tax=Pseudorhodoferax sp. TaxID=1993553 RepID=UPI002DD6709F|nr:S8 family serine peptidase [Pseudorhodoferax sp.]